MNLALIHDYLAQAGGAERVVSAMHEIYPEAPLYTSVYDPSSTLPCFAEMDVRTSFLQRWPVASKRWHKLALPFYPAAFERMDLTGYDVVLSSTSGFAKGVLTGPETCHVCYCHTPARFAWRQREYLNQSRDGRLLAPFLGGLLRRLRAWDLASAGRVDYFVANSHNVAQRIRAHYGREAAVIYPPIETSKYAPVSGDQVGDYFLVVSRLVGYKRIDLAIEACNRLRLPLRVIGTGPELPALRRLAGPTVQFLGRRPDAEVAEAYARCRALIFPGEEDFGLTPLEAMASGRPVVAYGAGGALETVVAGETGLFFPEQTPDSLAAALTQAQTIPFSPDALRAHALRFDKSLFLDRLRQFVDDARSDHQRRSVFAHPAGLLRPGDAQVPVRRFGFRKGGAAPDSRQRQPDTVA